MANTSQTAAPVANSTGSVSNQAVQVLQGNLMENQYGAGVVCQNAMLTVSPFVTTDVFTKTPTELHLSHASLQHGH